MASSSSSSSATSVVVNVLSPRVFVNFRGDELRYNFISHLRRALIEGDINFFIDDQLVPGENLETLYKEIEDSEIALAIFSERYSESKWCLNELLKIMENVEKRNLRVIPIFFNVTVDDVKNRKNSFGLNLYGNSHHDRTNMPKWEKALKSVTAFSGLIRRACENESNFVDDIVVAVKKVQVLISPVSEGGEPTDMISPVSEGGEPTNMISTKNISSVTSSGNILSGTIEQPIMNLPLYGIEQWLTQLEEKLFDFKYAKRRIVGIVGLPGIGKTTLAKEYYKKWSNKEFVFNEYISGNQELEDWLNDTLLSGQELNDQAKMFTRKVLVVFDDVSQEQVDFLRQNRKRIDDGSKIVITTHDKSLIKLLADDIYLVPGLNDKEALQLFKDHTLGSWTWKKILKYRDLAASLCKVEVYNGASTSFWYDNWSPLGKIIDITGPWRSSDMGIPIHSTMECVLATHRTRRHRVDFLNEIEKAITDQRQKGRSEGEDVVLWQYKGDKFKSKFSSKATWRLIREAQPTMEWHKGIWFTYNTPKYSFLAWLAIKNRLSTCDRMLSWNNGASTRCSLCPEKMETRDHIFFTCPYSAEIWYSLTHKLLASQYTTQWDTVLGLLVDTTQEKIKLFLLRYAFQITIHSIWRERNGRRHGATATHQARLVKCIDKQIRNKLSTIRAIGDARFDKAMEMWFATT